MPASHKTSSSAATGEPALTPKALQDEAQAQMLLIHTKTAESNEARREQASPVFSCQIRC